LAGQREKLPRIGEPDRNATPIECPTECHALSHVAFTRNKPAFLRALRHAVFELVKALSRGDTAAGFKRQAFSRRQMPSKLLCF
jgi:hypothetical protein